MPAAALIAFPQPVRSMPVETPPNPLSELESERIVEARAYIAGLKRGGLRPMTAAELVQTVEHLRGTLSSLLCSTRLPQAGWSDLWEAEAADLATMTLVDLTRTAVSLKRAIGRIIE